MKNKVLKQMLAFSLAVALVGGNSVATFAAEPTNGTESSANTQAATDATAEKVAVVNFNIENGKFDNGKNYAQYQLRAGDVQDLPKVTVDDGYEFLGWTVSGKSDTTWKASKKVLLSKMQMQTFTQLQRQKAILQLQQKYRR